MEKGLLTMQRITELYKVTGDWHPFSEHFDCRRFDEFTTQAVKSLPAHRNMFNIICLITKGMLYQHVNDKSYELKENTLFIAGAGHVQSWELMEPLEGYIILFTNDFFSPNHNQYNPITDFPFYQLGDAACLTLPNEHVRTLSYLFKQILQEQQAQDHFALIRSYLYTLFLHIRRMYNENGAKERQVQGIPRHTAKRFQQLVNEHYEQLIAGKRTEPKQVSEFADELHVHPNYLNEIVNKLYGKSASQLIRDIAVQKAITLLKLTDLTVSEIAFKLGFGSVGYFCRFFKKVTGKTPSRYRSSLNFDK